MTPLAEAIYQLTLAQTPGLSLLSSEDCGTYRIFYLISKKTWEIPMRRPGER